MPDRYGSQDGQPMWNGGAQSYGGVPQYPAQQYMHQFSHQGQPYIQPLVIVPYVSQHQPILVQDYDVANPAMGGMGGMGGGMGMNPYMQGTAMPQAPAAGAEAVPVKKGNKFSVLALILSLLIVVALFARNIYPSIVENIRFFPDSLTAIKNAPDIFKNLSSFDINTLLAVFGNLGAILFGALTFIFSIATVKKPKAPLIVKIFFILTILCVAAFVVGTIAPFSANAPEVEVEPED